MLGVEIFAGKDTYLEFGSNMSQDSDDGTLVPYDQQVVRKPFKKLFCRSDFVVVLNLLSVFNEFRRNTDMVRMFF